MGQISGTIDQTIKLRPFLIQFSLDFNPISGTIPQNMTAAPYLTVLTLDSMFLDGELPDWMSRCPPDCVGIMLSAACFRAVNLQIFSAPNNNLQGSIPPFNRNLRSLNLGHNNFYCAPPVVHCSFPRRPASEGCFRSGQSRLASKVTARRT